MCLEDVALDRVANVPRSLLSLTLADQLFQGVCGLLNGVEDEEFGFSSGQLVRAVPAWVLLNEALVVPVVVVYLVPEKLVGRVRPFRRGCCWFRRWCLGDALLRVWRRRQESRPQHDWISQWCWQLANQACAPCRGHRGRCLRRSYRRLCCPRCLERGGLDVRHPDIRLLVLLHSSLLALIVREDLRDVRPP